jgi:N-acetylmuramoyl-L-alanine amidase
LLLLALCHPVFASPVQVQGIRMWPAPDNTRLVFDVSSQVKYHMFTLDNPKRLVIDLADTRIVKALPSLALDKSLIKDIRTAPRNNKDLRVVLDLKTDVDPKAFALKPYQDYGHRLVVDLHDPKLDQPQPAQQREENRDIVIAIDAGHGGEDGGARGRRGTREKDVVLDIARQLHQLVDDEPGMRPVLIRKGDYYLGLRKRMDLARRKKADLFVSIHADAFRDGRARGSSVYVLSQRGASSEAARWLAVSENKSDLIGGVSLDDKDNVLASVLLDLSQTASIEASLNAGSRVLHHLKKIGPVHKRQVQQAGFVVLKSPDIPSILVETAFISNPREEAKLRSNRFQRSVAVAILKGVREYFQKFPPPGTRLAETRHHVISRGDTLSELASRYNVSVRTLKSVNNLKSDVLSVGQTLTIPVAVDS